MWQKIIISRYQIIIRINEIKKSHKKQEMTVPLLFAVKIFYKYFFAACNPYAKN